MITLLIDTTNILFRSMFAAQGFGSEYYTYDSSEECEILMRKLTMDCAQIIRTINPSRIIFCNDAKSWRKKITIEENEGYKGQRKKDEKINWDNIYNILDEFHDIMSRQGYINYIIKGTNEGGGAEADDCIAMWSEELYNNNQRIVIVSGDEDVRQLVKCKTTDSFFSFISVFNPFKQGKNASKKIIHGEGFIEWVNTSTNMSIFDMCIDGDKEDFIRLYNDPEIKFEYVDGESIALKKLLCGDDGDNIPAFYTWRKVTAKGKETTDRITKGKYEKIINELNIKCIGDITDDILLKIKERIEGFAKSPMNCNIYTRYDRQKKLVELKSSNFPEHITEYFKKTKDDILDKPLFVNSASVRMQDILKGTRYLTDGDFSVNKKRQSTIFNDLDKYTKLI